MSETASRSNASEPAARSSTAITLFVLIGALTLIRIAVLANSFINLGGDEAQYWSWSRELALGYFSKPPMIAWLIAGTTSVCGNSEACVRLSSPLLHGATAIVIFFLARKLYSERIGFWSAITYTTLPIVWFSTGLVTTDVPLVLCWAIALLFLQYFISASADGRKPDALKFAVLTGAAIGVGLLAKYAMIYFLICGVIYAVVSREARRAFFTPAAALILIVAAVFFAPNLIWNATSSFATFEHTAADANWGAELFNARKLGEFLVAQVGIFGPIPTIAFLFGLLTLKQRLKGEERRSDVYLLCYSLPIFSIVLVQSFISRANANWAAPAYIATVILTVAWLLRSTASVKLLGRFQLSSKSFLFASLIIHLVCGMFLYSMISVPGAIEFAGLENSFKRVRGWDTLAAKLQAETANGDYKAIVADNRLVTAEIIYYARAAKLPIVVFDADGKPANEYEMNRPYTPALGDPVLLVTPYADSKVPGRFTLAEPLGTFRMEQGGPKHTDFHLIRLAGFKHGSG